MGGDNDESGGGGRKPILQGDDLPAEDAIASANDADLPEPEPALGEWQEPVELLDDESPAGFGHDRLELGDDDRLPWLESADDIGDEGVDSGRIVGFVLLGLVALAMIVGAVWFASNRAAGPGAADGSLIRAEKGPYKVPPENPGGKTFEGTGDSSFPVSEGQTRGAKLAGSESTAPAAAETSPATPASPAAGASPAAATAAPVAAGVGVQVGAYSSPGDAEKGWATLVGRNSVLSGLKHRVIEGQADIGKVYRLQAIAADPAAANALCDKLKAAGQGCQVKR